VRRWPRRLARAILTALALLVAAPLALLAYAQVENRRVVTLPAPTGAERVGRVLLDWRDESRMDPYSPDRHTPRELSVWIWYPADRTARARPAAYAPDGWERALAYPGDFGQTAPSAVRAHATDGPPVAPGRFPLLVLGPGLGQGAVSYTTIAEELASHGYVVAGVNPTYSTTVVRPGGRLVHAEPRAADDADLEQLDAVWTADMRFVAGRTLALDGAPAGLFAAHLDAGRLGYLGHSAGGAAAAEACREDPRCAGAADFDGDLAGEAARTGLDRPFLFVGHEGSLGESPATPRTLRGALGRVPAGQGHVLTIAGTRHDDFTDRSAMFNLFGRQLGVLGPLGGARALRVAGAYVRAFFDAALGRGDGALLAGPSPAYPEVRFESL
jgi:dienelactone hydrolase